MASLHLVCIWFAIGLQLTTTVAHTVPVSFENYSCNENSLDIVILERRVTERRISNFTLSPNKGYEITSDVWNSICDLPIVYSEYDE